MKNSKRLASKTTDAELRLLQKLFLRSEKRKERYLKEKARKTYHQKELPVRCISPNPIGDILNKANLTLIPASKPCFLDHPNRVNSSKELPVRCIPHNPIEVSDANFTLEPVRKSCFLDHPIEDNSCKAQHVVPWTKRKLLGRGAHGVVYLFHNETVGYRAVKIVKITDMDDEKSKDVKSVENEINVLKKLDHERIVRYFGSQQEQDEIRIFMEYMPIGSLKMMIDKSRGLSESQTQVYSKQILEGLDFLHKNKIIHRDLKAANILLDKRGVKLADFGVSKFMNSLSSGQVKTITGTIYWMSPEMIGGVGYGRKTDIWSLACVILEMLTTRTPWSHLESQAAMFKIGMGEVLDYRLPECVSDTCGHILDLCFKKDPEERPRAEDLLNHPWIIDVSYRDA